MIRAIRVSIDKSAGTMQFWRITGMRQYPYRAIVESILDSSPQWASREFSGWREFQKIESNLES